MPGPIGSTPDVIATLATNVFLAGQTVPTPLPKDQVQKRLYLRLEVDVTQAGGGATVIADNPMSLVKQIQVVGAHRTRGTVTLKQASLTNLYWTAAFKRGVKPFRAELASGGAQANTILVAMVPVDFYATDVEAGGGAMLPAYDYTDLTLQVTWGTATDLLSAGATINAARIDVIKHEIPGLDVSAQYVRNVEATQATAVPGTGRFQLFELPTVGAYKSLTFRCSDPGAAGRPLTNGIFTGAIIVQLAGSTNSRELSWSAQQEISAWLAGSGPSPGWTDAAGVRAQSIAAGIGVANLPDGYSRIDFASNAGMTGMLDASRLTSLRVFGDVTTAGFTAPLIECLINRFES